MDKESASPNIEWKKNGFDFNEKATLKTNIKKIVEKEAKDKNAGLKRFAPSPAELPGGIRKIRKKVKQVFDDEEDEEEYQIAAPAIDPNSSLLNALQDDEKKFLKQHDDIMSINSMQKAGRDQSVLKAQQIAKESGLKHMDKKVLAENLQDISIGKDVTAETVKGQVSKSLKYKKKNLSDNDLKKILIGAKKMQAMAGKDAVEGVRAEDILEIGEKKRDEKDTKIILQKTGRVDAKGKPVKANGGVNAKNMEMIERMEKSKESGRR